MSYPEDAAKPDAPAGDFGLFRRFEGERDRRWQMRGVAQRFWRWGPSWLDWHRLERHGLRRPELGGAIKHYSKALAQVILTQRDYLLWSGHDPDNADGVTTAQIRAAIRMLMADRGASTPDRPDALNEGLLALQRVLDRSPDGDVWNGKTFLVDHHRAGLLDKAHDRHPCITNYLSRAAEQLREQYEQYQRDGTKLEREIAEGDLPLHERLRKMVCEWRRQGFLPRTPPRALWRDPTPAGSKSPLTTS